MQSSSLKKIVDNISQNKNLQKLMESFHNLSEEIKGKEAELKKSFDKEKDAQIEKAWKQYQKIVKMLSASETKLDKEVKKTVQKIKTTADGLEKNIMTAKNKARTTSKKIERKTAHCCSSFNKISFLSSPPAKPTKAPPAPITR